MKRKTNEGIVEGAHGLLERFMCGKCQTRAHRVNWTSGETPNLQAVRRVLEKEKRACPPECGGRGDRTWQG
jgi:hypothetical protein